MEKETEAERIQHQLEQRWAKREALRRFHYWEHNKQPRKPKQ